MLLVGAEGPHPLQESCAAQTGSEHIWGILAKPQRWGQRLLHPVLAESLSSPCLLLLTELCVCVCVCESVSHVRLFATPWTVARQAPLSMEFSRQEYWSGLLLPSPGESSWPKCRTWVSCVAGRFLTVWATRKLYALKIHILKFWPPVWIC